MDQYITEERKFLHDLSNQLVVAQGMGSWVRKAINKREDAEDKEKERIEKTLNAINSIIELVKDRRAHIKGIQGETEP